jgi:hypothetical protein
MFAQATGKKGKIWRLHPYLGITFLAWPLCKQNLALGAQNPLKSEVTGPSALVKGYVKIEFHKK